MIQKQVTHDPELPHCTGCRRPGKHWVVLGKNMHMIECSRCGISTAKHAEFGAALAQWGAQNSYPLIQGTVLHLRSPRRG